MWSFVMIRNVNTHTHTRYNNYISIQFSLFFFCVWGLIYLAKFYIWFAFYVYAQAYTRTKHEHMHTHTMIKFYFITFARFFHLNRFGNHRLLPCTDCSVFNEHMKWDWSKYFINKEILADETQQQKKTKEKQTISAF